MLGTKKITTILQFTTDPTVGMCVNIIYFQDMMFSVFVVFLFPVLFLLLLLSCMHVKKATDC